MKSEERHKLETNYLADHLGDGISKVKPFVNLILGGIVVLIFGGLIYAYFQNATAKKNAEAWNEMFLADGDADQLTRVYEDYEGTLAAPWARQRQADNQLARAIDQVYTDKDQALELVKQAKENYEAVLTDSTDSMLRARATLGLAKACETEGDAEGALSNYKRLLTMDIDNKVLSEEVTRRVAWLESDQSKEFLTWFKSFQPTKAAPLGLPSNLNQTPAVPDMTLPEYKPAGPGIVPAPGQETIATPPAADAPAGQTPAGETPAAQPPAAAPAEGTPAPAAEQPKAETPAPTEPSAPADPATPPAAPAEGGGSESAPKEGGQ
jgi:hypothetical protein